VRAFPSPPSRGRSLLGKFGSKTPHLLVENQADAARHVEDVHLDLGVERPRLERRHHARVGGVLLLVLERLLVLVLLAPALEVACVAVVCNDEPVYVFLGARLRETSARLRRGATSARPGKPHAESARVAPDSQT